MTRHRINHSDCLADETLTDYLGAALDPAMRVAAEAHLVYCDDCRTKLAFFMRLLKDEVTENEALATLQAEQVLARNRGRTRQSSGGRRRRYLRGPGGIAAALLLAIGTWVALDKSSEPRSASQLIHLLLAKNRPFEARISGQPYLPYTFTRGDSYSGSTNFSLLAGQMNRLSATTYEMGQFYLLQKDFGNAITYLELASRELGATAEIHNDLGVAYMESGFEMNQPKAIAEFRRALGNKPDYLPAEFNLAVLYERLGNNDQAEKQWAQYLAAESERSWKDEAKAKLEGMKR